MAIMPLANLIEFSSKMMREELSRSNRIRHRLIALKWRPLGNLRIIAGSLALSLFMSLFGLMEISYFMHPQSWKVPFLLIQPLVVVMTLVFMAEAWVLFIFPNSFGWRFVRRRLGKKWEAAQKAFRYPWKVHWSFTVVLGIWLIGMGVQYYFGGMPLSELVRQLGIFAILLVSVMAHEYGHLFMAIWQGYTPVCVVLHGLGGSIRLKEGTPIERDFQKVLWAGPLANVILACMIDPLALLLHHPVGFTLDAPLAAELEYWLHTWILINLSMAFFNLLPIWPLDGGRLLYSAFLLPHLKEPRYTEKEEGDEKVVYMAYFPEPGSAALARARKYTLWIGVACSLLFGIASLAGGLVLMGVIWIAFLALNILLLRLKDFPLHTEGEGRPQKQFEDEEELEARHSCFELAKC